MTAERKRLTFILLAPIILLLIPFIGMQFSEEVNWTIGDFIIAGVLLFGTGLILELLIRKVKEKRTKLILVSLVLLGLIILWAELAVGIFGSPLAGS